MNINDNPTQDQLRKLLANCNDMAGHHIVWVDRAGTVQISLLPPDLTPAMWSERLGHDLKFRLETLGCGNGYVGLAASQDEQWVGDLFRWLQRSWRGGSEGLDAEA